MTTEEAFAQLGELIREKMAAWLVPGAAVGVWFESQLHAAGYGVTSVENPVPVNDRTLFQVGSITKTFTATAVMRLVEDGRLALDAPVGQYLPDWRVADEAATRQVTVRHLLNHMSNWVGDVFVDTGPGDDALQGYAARMAELTQLAPLGTAWSYNNAGFGLLGLLIETATGQTYDKAIRELVTEPLGLEQLYFGPAEVISRRFAVGHQTEEGKPVVARPWAMPRAVDPIGGIITDVRTLLAYARFHLGDGTVADGTRLLSPAALAQMQTPTATIRGQDESMGLSWFVTNVGGQKRLHHGGGTKGQTSLLLLFPERAFAMAILTNGDDGGHITQAAADWVQEHLLGLASEKPELTDLSPSALASYAGHYRRPFQDLELWVAEGRLMAQPTFKQGFPDESVPPSPKPPPMTCAFYGPDLMIVLDTAYENSRAEFIRLDDSSIGWLRFGGRLHRRDKPGRAY